MVKFGAFADLHYAKDLTIGNRKCGLSLLKLQNLIDDFNSRELDFCICLGDIITSVQNYDIDKSNTKGVSTEFKKFNMSNHIILGNHDLEGMSKSDFYTIFNKKPDQSFYSFTIEDTKFVVLDANYLADGSDYSNGNYNWIDSYINKAQLEWLENELITSKENKIVIFTHQNLDYRLHNGKLDCCVIKNYKEVSQVLENSNKKITVIQGHYHNGDHQVINGIEYITLKAVCVGDDTSYMPRIIVSIDDEISIEYQE